MKIMPRKSWEIGGIVCLPLIKNIPNTKNRDWKKVKCPRCGEDCWESDLARKAIANGTAAACTLCALQED